MAKSGLFKNHPCPHCGEPLTTKVWKEKYFCCEQCGVGMYSNGPWIVAIGIVVGAPLLLLLYGWLRMQYGSTTSRLIGLPLDIVIALAFAVLADLLLRVRVDAAMSEAIRAAERLRRSNNQAQ